MADEFNAYHEWLGLAPDVASPNYYQLLGVPTLEADLEKIALAGDRATTRVRSFRPGSHARQWSELIDEIFAAKTCLLDPDIKAEYDRRLERRAVAANMANDDRRPVPSARPAVDSERYPPGMAPPGARPAASQPVKESAKPATEHVAAPEPVPELPPNVYSPAAPLPQVGIAATAYDQSYPGGPQGYVPLAMPLAGYGGAYPPGMYGQPMAMPYGAMPMASPPPAPPPPMTPDATAYYGGPAAIPLNPSPLDPMAPVAVPGMPTGYAAGGYAADDGRQRIVGFAGAMDPLPQATRSSIPLGCVPLGTAVPAAVEAAIGTGTPAGSTASLAAAPQVPATSAAHLAERHEQQQRRNLLIAGVGGGAILLAALLVYANWPPPGDDDTTVAQQNIVPGDGPQPLPRTIESPLPGGKPTPLPTPAPAPTPTPRPAPPPTPLPEPMPEPAPEPAPMPAPAAPEPPAPEPMPPAPMPEPPTPTPPPMPEPMPMDMPTPAELTALGKALTMGKAALTEQNFDEADKFIAEAQSLAKTPEHRALAARLKEVAGYVRQFRKAVELSASEFEAAESFMVGTSTRVSVVEVLPDRIIIRHTGQNKVYPYGELPPGLAMAIADFKLDPADPASRVVKGAFYAVAKGDQQTLHEKARSWWEEAQLGGVDLAHLMPFLTDKYDLAEPKTRPGNAKPPVAKPDGENDE